MKKYYLHQNGNQTGPFSFEELKGFSITPETPVWVEGLPVWLAAKDIPEISTLLTKSPPPFPVQGTIKPSRKTVAKICFYCKSELRSDATNCANCGRLRKDIRLNQQISRWLFLCAVITAIVTAILYVLEKDEYRRALFAPEYEPGIGVIGFGILTGLLIVIGTCYWSVYASQMKSMWVS
jgi:hypothetical protein